VAAGFAHLLVRWTLDALFGLDVPIASGALDGVILGAAAGAGYGAATSRLAEGGMAAPSGPARLQAAAVVAAGCAVAALALALAGRPLVGGTVNEVARASRGSRLALAPLGRLIGEPDFGSVTGALIGALEGAMFGFGLTMGLTHRPR
jgi:hypothetical protein